MRIAFLGETSDIGEGLILRWTYHTNHRVAVRSRDPDKAHAKIDEYETELSGRGHDMEVNGLANKMAADRASMVVLAVPPCHISGTVEVISNSLPEGDVLVTPATGMKRGDDGFHYRPPKMGSVATLVADAAPNGMPVIGAFHSLAAGRLADPDTDLGIDTLLVADDEDTEEAVHLLTEGIDGLHALDGGGLANAPEIEGITPLLINVTRNNDGLYDLGIRFK